MIKRTLAFTTPARLNLRAGQLVITLPEVETDDTLPAHVRSDAVRTVPIEDIGVVVLDNPDV